MRKVIIILVGLIIASCAINSKTEYSLDKDVAYLKITQNTTATELKQIAAEFKNQKNIVIDYSESEFNRDGKINLLSLKVDCNDGFSGTTKISNLLLKMHKCGFLRDYRSKTKIPFSIGKM